MNEKIMNVDAAITELIFEQVSPEEIGRILANALERCLYTNGFVVECEEHRFKISGKVKRIVLPTFYTHQPVCVTVTTADCRCQ